MPKGIRRLIADGIASWKMPVKEIKGGAEKHSKFFDISIKTPTHGRQRHIDEYRSGLLPIPAIPCRTPLTPSVLQISRTYS